MVVLQSEVHQLSTNTSGVAVSDVSAALITTTAPSAAQVVSVAIKTGSLQHASKHKTKCAVGTSNRSKLLSAKVMKLVDLFVTRFDCNTSCADISANMSDT